MRRFGKDLSGVGVCQLTPRSAWPSADAFATGRKDERERAHRDDATGWQEDSSRYAVATHRAVGPRGQSRDNAVPAPPGFESCLMRGIFLHSAVWETPRAPKWLYWSSV